MSSHGLSNGERSEDQDDSSRTANLARIRDNQRRSRARRKEYLSELETKYRQCEQAGVEASAEIQSAARKVIDENKKLRVMLRQRGLSDYEIDSTIMDNQDFSQSLPSAIELESMLGVRKTCGPNSGGCGPQMNELNTGAPNQGPRIAPAPPQIQTKGQNQLYPSPPSNSSSGGGTPSNFTPMQAHQPLRLTGQMPAQMDFNNMSHDDMMAWQGNGQQQQQLHRQQMQSDELPDPRNSTSCYVAANAIRTIKPDAGYELEQELGCGPSGDCNVPNSQIFSIMDRYQGGA